MKSFIKVTETIYKPLWIRLNFTTYSEGYENIRKKYGGKGVICIKCGHKFNYGEEVALACFENIGNDTLCSTCAKELNE
jgi:hypothetical protein